MTFWPNIECDIPGDTCTLIGAHAADPLHVHGWILKGHGISLFFIMEKS